MKEVRKEGIVGGRGWRGEGGVKKDGIKEVRKERRKKEIMHRWANVGKTERGMERGRSGRIINCRQL